MIRLLALAWQGACANLCCARVIQTTLPKPLGQLKRLRVWLYHLVDYRAEGPEPVPGTG